MKIFWIIVALLALVSAFIVPLGGADPVPPAFEIARDAPAPDTANAPADTPQQPDPAEATEPTEQPPTRNADADTTPETSSDTTTTQADDQTDPEIDSGSAETPVAQANQQSLSENDSSVANDETTSDDDALVAKDDETTSDEEPASSDPAKPLIELQEDGSMLVDGNYVIRGDGSRESPYVVGWDYFISASQEYIPREGLDVIPPRIQMLHDQWVQVVGYYIFPMFVSEVNESLVMQNQWDGCCIGVPPSVYDSIEVRLAKPRSMKRGHFALYGQFTGKMNIDPYLANGWLIGLYLLEEADLKVDL